MKLTKFKSTKLHFAKIFTILSIAIFSTSAQAGMFDFISKAFEAPKFESHGISECGKQIAVFKKFHRDGKICKKDMDCVAMEGQCPLGCNFFVNKNFVEILNTEMEKVSEVCTSSVCASKCAEITPQVKCVRNKCENVNK